MVLRPSTCLSDLALENAWYEKGEGLPSAQCALRGLNAQISTVISALSWEVWLLHTLAPKAWHLVQLLIVSLGARNAFSLLSLHLHGIKGWTRSKELSRQFLGTKAVVQLSRMVSKTPAHWLHKFCC